MQNGQARIKGLGKVDEATLKSGMKSYFGEEGEKYNIKYSINGWTINVPEYEITYLVKEEQQGDMILSLVDDLGTRSTIYLYNNSDLIKEGTITITMPNNTNKTITAIEDTSNITNASNYATYTVDKNGTYDFKATFNAMDGVYEREITVNVNNIEQFTSIETLASEQGLSYAGGKTNAYSYKGAVVPKGYYVDTASEVATGLVVTDAIDSEGYSTGNEWVWVPVDSPVGNSDYYLTGSGNMAGATSVSYTKYSKLWNFTTNSSTGVTTRGNLEATQAQPSATSGYREPAILTTSYGEVKKYNLVKNRTTGTAFSNGIDVATQYRDDYETMVASVDNYHGFYIGRYELTTNGEKPGTVRTSTNWYNYYNQCLTLGNSYTESGMIYGCLWDATLQWLARSGYWVGSSGKTYSGYGNYKSEAVKVNSGAVEITVKPQNISQILLTGQTSYTNSYNIYDLSGNGTDWTQEATGTNARVSRGGVYSVNSSSSTYSASRGAPYATSTSNTSSSRASFYIK